MDRTTRWETEAIRKRPMPSGRRVSGAENRASGNWVTLREAEAETGIPVNTLRKWIRRADLPSYLEADGDLALRMVDLDAVITRAKELGRSISPKPDSEAEADVPVSEGRAEASTPTPKNEAESSVLLPDTMIVPIDAWNKMLNQLGNLHEAGQQLAEARERAAKAETESKFLRVQLAEQRNTTPRPDDVVPEVHPQDTEPPPEPAETTSYWRYVTSGWRERKKRRG